MESREVSRRAVLQGSAALAGLALLGFPGAAAAFPSRPGEEVVPWLDQPAPNPVPEAVGQQLVWEALDSWVTPTDKFFTVQHYNRPIITGPDAAQGWRLALDGLVQRPLALSLAELRARPRQEVTFTLECSGNHGLPFFTGGIGNAAWAGTPLAPLLKEAGVLDRAKDVVFWGSDTGPEEVRGAKITERFARSMAVADALDPQILLCYEMNGAPLPHAHGFPLRLLAPGWYGVANVKWLQRIEVLGTRYEGRFMGRDYVTMREEQRDGATTVRFTSVGRALLKSAPARVTRQGGAYRIVGAAWGAPIARVEVQIDGGPWTPATLEEGAGGEVAWTIWSLEWGRPAAGEHAVTSRAVATDGRIQPAPDDPAIARKLTYWESNGQITRRVRIA
ncbi:MAG TPA: molybdopterin-dependent oxidoreductase [Vicinamibacteria bacterium]